MKAFTISRYGKKEKLQLTEVATPTVKPDEVLVQVSAAGVNSLDSLIRNGDFKLFAALGAWLGWMYLPLILLLSSLSGAIIGTIYLHRSNQPKTCAIPFGPFLGVSGLICLFWGPQIINEYRVLLSF